VLTAECQLLIACFRAQSSFSPICVISVISGKILLLFLLLLIASFECRGKER
jgi:hypothetical protein